MHDRTNNISETSSASSNEQRKHEHQPWVNKYLELADAALSQKAQDESDQAA